MTKPCPKCNQLNPPEAAFCLNCASSLAPAVQNQQFQQQPLGNQAMGQPIGTASGPSQKAVIALILAIVALFCCGPFAGVPAAIVGWLELTAIKEGRSPANGKWMAMAGLWGGIAATLIHGVLYLIYVFISMLGAMSSPYYY